jgi:hypothetical protein
MTGWSHQPIFLFMISMSFAMPLIVDGRGKYIKILCNHRAVAYGCGRSKMVACCCISENTQLEVISVASILETQMEEE